MATASLAAVSIPAHTGLAVQVCCSTVGGLHYGYLLDIVAGVVL